MTHQTAPPLAGEIEGIRERHDKAQKDWDAPGPEVLNATYGWCVYTAGSSHRDRATLLAALDKAQGRIAGLVQILSDITDLYCDLAASGDAGFWNPEEVPQIIAARSLLPSPGTKGEVG